jgi:hypothetical protein
MANLITHPTRIVKTRDVLIRVGVVADVNRPTVNYLSGTDQTEIFRVDNQRLTMYEFQGSTQADFGINDTETDYRLIGDSGWRDGVITDSRVQMSITAYVLKSLEWTGDPNSPHYFAPKGKLDEVQSIISRFKNNKDTEVWVEIYKLIDPITNGCHAYELSCFAGTMMNFKDAYPADGLVELTMDVMSRGEAYMGLYSAINPLRTGLPNRLTAAPLPLFSETGTVLRQVVPSVTVTSTQTNIPNDTNVSGGITGVNTGTDVTFTYRDGAATPAALTNLVAASDAVSLPKARLVKKADYTFVPATVTVNAGSGTVVLNPVTDLEAATEYFAEVELGTLLQKVDAAGASSASGTARPLPGLRTSVFKTV